MAKKTEMIGFKTTPAVKEALATIAAQEDRSISYIINRILMQHLELSDEQNEDQCSFEDDGNL